MSATKRRKAICAGYGDGAGLLHPCGSPSLPVERSGRCIRCERLQRGDELAQVDPFTSVNDIPLPGEGLYRRVLGEALRPATSVATIAPAPAVAVEPEPVATVAVAPTPEPVAAKPWHSLWPACLLCGKTKTPHGGRGLCNSCSVRSNKWHRVGRGLAVIWLPFAGDDAARYDPAGAFRWVTARDLAEAWAYLERRAAINTSFHCKGYIYWILFRHIVISYG